MSNNAMSSLAAKAPTSKEELHEMEILGENIEKEYGERLVKSIKSFIQQNNLDHLIENRKSKRQKIESTPDSFTQNGETKVEIVDITDEFDAGIDFSAIEIPETMSVSPQLRRTTKSTYFSAKKK